MKTGYIITKLFCLVLLLGAISSIVLLVFKLQNRDTYADSRHFAHIIDCDKPQNKLCNLHRRRVGPKEYSKKYRK